MRKLKIRGRYLLWEDGEPFFYLGDTAWELFHRLNREEIDLYFKERARQGFTAAQCVALSEFDGLTVPNYYGRLPLLFTDGVPDPDKPDLGEGYNYWEHVDYAVGAAAKNGIFIVMLPAWGDKINLAWGKGLVVFNVVNAHNYGRWIASRYKDRPNIIWMLGGDRPLEPEHRAVIDAMAAGILSEDKNHLVTFHPPGARDSTDFVGTAPYIDFHTAQTGHSVEQCYFSNDIMRKMAAASDKPYMDSEPRYEDHPANFMAQTGFLWDSADVRQNAYWDVLAGACGHTYGNHCVWSMTRETTPYFPYVWDEALTHAGAEQIGFVKKLRLSRDYFSLRGEQGLLDGNFTGMGHMVSALGDGYAYIYSPLGIPFTLDPSPLGASGPIRALWLDLRTGEEKIFAVLHPRDKTTLAPPSQGKGCDWVLILEKV